MEGINNDSLLIIFSYLDDNSLLRLSETYNVGSRNINKIWSIKIKQLFEKVENIPPELSKKIYFLLKRSLTKKDPYSYIVTNGENDIIVYNCINILINNHYNIPEDAFLTLFMAVKFQYINTVNVLLQSNSENITSCVMDKYREGCFSTSDVLKYAVKMGNMDIIKLLITNRKFVVYASLLTELLQQGEVELVELLSTNGVVGFGQNDKTIKNLLKLVYEMGYKKILYILLQNDNNNIDPSFESNFLLKKARLEGDSNIVQSLLKFQTVKELDIYQNNVLENSDSISGLIAIQSYYGLKTNNLINYLKFSPKYPSGPDRLYYQLLKSIIVKKGNMVDRINMLTQLMENKDEYTKTILRIAVERALINSKLKRFPPGYNDAISKDHYYTYSGFFLLCYKPEYSYKEIITIMAKEKFPKDAIIRAMKLVGAQKGLSKLIKEGFMKTNEIQGHINNLSLFL
jgi:hypothetical protein